MTNTVLVVEDEPLLREALGQTLELAGFRPILANAFIVAKDHVSPEFPGAILSDIRMPGRDGMFLLNYVRSVDDELPVILLTGEGDIPLAVEAINKGAFDFLEKPCPNDVLVEAVKKALRTRSLVLENRHLKSEITRGDVAARKIFGVSDKAEALRDQVRRLAEIDDAVLIDGAPGSGTAKVAEVLHLLSSRVSGPFLRVAGPGLTPERLSELLEQGGDGTIFIDDVAAIPRVAQHVLLEHLDAGGGARIVAGTTRRPTNNPPEGVEAELHYRLDGLRIRVPALSERTEDIPVIFRQYVREAAQQSAVQEPEVTSEVIASLMARDWPGNTRELMNAAIRFVLGLEPTEDNASVGLVERMNTVERTLIIEALMQHRGNASASAQALKLPRKTFYDKLAKHGIKAETYR